LGRGRILTPQDTVAWLWRRSGLVGVVMDMFLRGSHEDKMKGRAALAHCIWHFDFATRPRIALSNKEVTRFEHSSKVLGDLPTYIRIAESRVSRNTTVSIVSASHSVPAPPACLRYRTMD